MDSCFLPLLSKQRNRIESNSINAKSNRTESTRIKSTKAQRRQFSTLPRVSAARSERCSHASSAHMRALRPSDAEIWWR